MGQNLILMLVVYDKWPGDATATTSPWSFKIRLKWHYFFTIVNHTEVLIKL